VTAEELPSSPRRDHSGGGSSTAREKDRPRSFDKKTRSACWRKAAVVAVRHPERWRRGAAGNVVRRRFWSCHGCLCYEYDHIVPFSKGDVLGINPQLSSPPSVDSAAEETRPSYLDWIVWIIFQ
jgi:hypothetical protein